MHCRWLLETDTQKQRTTKVTTYFGDQNPLIIAYRVSEFNIFNPFQGASLSLSQNLRIEILILPYPPRKKPENKSVGQKTLTSGLIAPVLWQAFPTSVIFSALVDSNFVSNFLPHSGRPVFKILGNFSHLPLPIPWIFPIGSHHCWSSIEKPLFPEVNPCISWTAVRLNIETSPSSSVSSLSATWINSKAPDYQTHHAQSDLYIV